MNNIVSVKTNFTSGQVSPSLYARGDLGVYANGARKLENVIIFPTGGVSRRAGLRFLNEISEPCRLVAFEFNTEQTYLLCFEPSLLKVFKEGQKIAELEAPWTAAQLANINWTQSADTLLVVHPEVAPRQISRNQDENWTVSEWEYYEKDGSVYCPYYNFYQKKVSLTPSGSSGTVKLSASEDLFDEFFVGSRIRINNGEGVIVSVNSPREVSLSVSKALNGTGASSEWEESAFSRRRGYPYAVTFHQDRLVVGGAYSLPNHLWLSKSSDLFNFDIGTGLDDEAIDFAILSDQVNAITNVVSTRHLLVFTTGAEWMVSGDPLTPSSIQLTRQTSVGSYNKFSLPPQNVDGATLFISQSGRQLREFLYADVEQAYQARDLTLLSSDIINKPCDIGYHQDESVLYIVGEDGAASCLTSYRSEEVNAWSRLKTDGSFLNVAVIGSEVYFAVRRGDLVSLEVMEAGLYADCSLKLRSETAQVVWSGLDYLEGREVTVVADGSPVGEFVVTSGQITLYEPASEIVAGLPYRHLIEPLPYMVDTAAPYPPKAVRMIGGIFRLLESRALNLDIGSGYGEVPLPRDFGGRLLDAEPSNYTGDVSVKAVGWNRDLQKPLWSIMSSKPCPFTLLGAVVEVKIKQ